MTDAVAEPPRTTRTIVKEISAEDLSLPGVRRAIPEDCFKPVAWKSWGTLIRVLLFGALGVFTLHHFPVEAGWSLLWQIPVLLALWFVHGTILVGFFLVGHDAQHNSFSKTNWVNRLVGYFCLAPLFNGAHTWKLTHNIHHAYTQLRGQDVDWNVNLVTEEEFKKLTWRKNFAIKLGYAMPFGIFFWIGRNTVRRGLAVRGQVGEKKYQQEKWELLFSNFLMLVCTGLIYFLFWNYLGFWGMMKVHGIPIAFSALIGGVLVTIGHASEHSIIYDKKGWSPIRGQLASTYNYRMPRWIEWLVLNVNIHLPHHISTKIPWYKLKAASRAIREAFPEHVMEKPLKWEDMTWTKKAPYLRYDQNTGMYDQVPSV